MKHVLNYILSRYIYVKHKTIIDITRAERDDTSNLNELT